MCGGRAGFVKLLHARAAKTEGLPPRVPIRWGNALGQRHRIADVIDNLNVGCFPNPAVAQRGSVLWHGQVGAQRDVADGG